MFGNDRVCMCERIVIGSPTLMSCGSWNITFWVPNPRTPPCSMHPTDNILCDPLPHINPSSPQASSLIITPSFCSAELLLRSLPSPPRSPKCAHTAPARPPPRSNLATHPCSALTRPIPAHVPHLAALSRLRRRCPVFLSRRVRRLSRRSPAPVLAIF